MTINQLFCAWCDVGSILNYSVYKGLSVQSITERQATTVYIYIYIYMIMEMASCSDLVAERQFDGHHDLYKMMSVNFSTLRTL